MKRKKITKNVKNMIPTEAEYNQVVGVISRYIDVSFSEINENDFDFDKHSNILHYSTFLKNPKETFKYINQ